MATYPTIRSYDIAVSNLNRFILVPEIAVGKPFFTRRGQMEAYAGAYSVVYPLNVNGRKIALKCWLQAPGEVAERYAKVKSYLRSHPTSYFVDFEYVDQGISANGNIYPIIYMEWIEGKTLSQFVDENIQKSAILIELADRFLAMAEKLHEKNISHGDLRAENIIVSENSATIGLKLVDYDCIFTPTLETRNYQNYLCGSPNYQHPNRGMRSNEKADYFSELVIYLSLLAYAEKPGLWKNDQPQRLLFTEDDFQNPSVSATFRMLEELSPRVRGLAYHLREFCYESDTNRLLPLEQVISSNSTLRKRDKVRGNHSSSPSPKEEQEVSEWTNQPPTPPSDNHDLKTSMDEKDYRVSISFPQLLSKRFDSVFLFQLYLPEFRSRVSRNIKAQFLEQPRIDFTDQSIIKFGQKIQIEFYSSHLDFSKPVIKLVDRKLTKVVFLGSPRDNCQPGTRNVRVSISDAETQLEIESFNIEVKVVDFAFDHVSRPLLSRAGALVLGIGSFAMYILTFLEQIDKTIGLASGTTAGVLALTIYASFYNLYQRVRPNTP